MTIDLGARWPERVVPAEPKYTVEDLRTEQILGALDSLREVLAGMPAPEVHVDAPDLTSIVMAVQGLKPGADADDIARAIVRELGGSSQQDANGVLQELVEAMKDLDFRMKGLAGGRGIGGGSAGMMQDLRDRADRQLGIVTLGGAASFAIERTLTERMFAKAPAAGFSLWLDTADAGFIYIVEAAEGSAQTDAVFRGIRVQKDANGNPLGEVQQATNFAWSSRGAASWL